MKAVIDIVLLIIIALCTWNGYRRGLVGGIAGILAIVIALFGGSLLSSAYAHEVVPAMNPFVDGYLDSEKNRDAILEEMGYADSELSVNDILAQDSSLRYDYAYEAFRFLGIFNTTAEKMAVEAVELSDSSQIDMKDAVVSVVCDKVSYVAGMALVFMMIYIFLVAVANVGNLSLRLPNMENLDEIGGAVIGFVKAFVLCVLFCWFLSFFGIVVGKDTIGDTTLARFFLAFDFIANIFM